MINTPTDHETLWAFLRSCSSTPIAPDYPQDRLSLFSPVDDVHSAIIAVLSQALIPTCGRSLTNMYGYDDNEVDEVLHRVAAEPHTTLLMNLDKSQAGGVHERILVEPWTQAPGTSVAIGHSAKGAISHLKVNVTNGLYVISGSTNWSLSGEQKQDNELTITCNRAVAAQFETILLHNHLVMLKQMAKH